MKKTNTSIIENEFQHRGASLEKGLSIKALRPFYEEITELKCKLKNRTSETLANIYYASELQKEHSDNIKVVLKKYLAETKNLDPNNVFMVTLNYCEGRGKNKKPHFIKPEQLTNFNVKKAKATICKQLNNLNNGFGFVSFEVKYDSRMGAFLPHFHVLICGENKKTLEQFFTKYFPSNYEFMLNKDTFNVTKNGDPLIYRAPQNLKVIDIQHVDENNYKKITTYLCKFRTYMTLVTQKYLTALAEDENNGGKKIKKKKIQAPNDIHCYHLMFLDKCHLSDVFYQFNKKLMTKFIGKPNEIKPNRDLKQAPNQERLAKIKKKAPRHNTYAEPLTTNDFVLKLFNYQSYKYNQEHIINHMKTHKSCIVIQKTNYGKSLCFYATALQLKGLCIVIEPLISLIHNQVSKLNKLRRKLALAYTSETKHQKKKLDNLKKGKYKFLYLAPEMLHNTNLLKVLSKLDISLIVTDEAHCIDLWGNDFRPDYKKLGTFIKKFPDAKIMALTATAGEDTQKVIKEVCNMPKDVKIFKGDLERTNIKYRVIEKKGDGFEQLLAQLNPYLDKNNKPTSSIIIYCAHIDYTRGLHKILKNENIDSYIYNSMVDNKKEILKKFMKENCIICATSAFGMGIDKPDVRLIVHFEATNNLEMYYQETGRAGRDEQPSKAVLFYSEREIQNMQRLAQNQSDFIKAKLDKAIIYMRIKNKKKRRKYLLNVIV
jgi:ATP-dependent DNA helicase, recQ family